MDAKFRFKAGKPEEAARLFLEAFALTRKPALLYNAARAYEEAGKPAEAKVAFEQYLGLPDVTSAGRADAKKHIAALVAKLAATKKAEEKAAADRAAAHKAAAHKAAADKAAADKAAADKAAADKAAADKVAADRAAAENAASAAGNNAGPNGGGITKQAGPSPRNRWLTYGLVGGGGLLTLLAVATQAGAVKKMQDANAMDFGVDNKTDDEQVKAKKNAYNTATQQAQQQQNSAMLGGVIGVGLAAWGVYRLVTPDPGVAATKKAGAWHAEPGIMANESGWIGVVRVGGDF